MVCIFGNIQHFSLDSANGICQKSFKSNNKCTFNKNENMCIYSNKYLATKPKDIILVLHSPYEPNPHSPAFNHNGDKGLFIIFKSLKEFDLVYQKVSSLDDIKKIVSSINPRIRIAHLIIMAHGQPKEIVLSNLNTLNYSNIDELVTTIKPKLSPNCSILLHSSLDGKGGSP